MESRAARRYMASWLERNPGGDAEGAWNALAPETQAHLFILSRREVQSGDDIREGLLATLHSYQGSRNIKKLFEEAIGHVEYN